MDATDVARDHLNDPNYDVDDLVRRSSKERIRNNSSALSAHPSASIRRRANAGPPPPLSPSLQTATTTATAAAQPAKTTGGTFPLISAIQNAHQFPPQQPYVHSTTDMYNPNHSPYGPPTPTPSGSQARSSSVDIPKINIQTVKSIDTDEYDLESIAQTSSSRRVSRDSYGFEKKGPVHDYDDMEMETRSDLEFEEYVLCHSLHPVVFPSRFIALSPSTLFYYIRESGL